MSENTELEEYSVYSDRVLEAINAIPDHVLNMDEDKLRVIVDPSIKDYELKRAFWAEVLDKQGKKRKIIVSHIYRNIFTKESFYRIIDDVNRMAWIIHPLTSYENKTQAALDKVTERYDELISMDINTSKKIKDDDGNDKWITETDPKKALVLLQVIKNLEDRIKGTSIQRQVSVHTDRPQNANGLGVGSVDMKAVNERLKELEHQLGDKGGFTDRENVASQDDGSSERESDDTVSDTGKSDNDEQLRDNISKKTIEMEQSDYREIDK